jgi:hypothetical protein
MLPVDKEQLPKDRPPGLAALSLLEFAVPEEFGGAQLTT